MPQHLLFSCLKNEGAFLLEWLAWHRLMGVDHALLFTNDCEDGTDRLADALQAAGVATHVPNHDGKRGPQWTALNSKPLQQALQSADWAMHLDVDEFVLPTAGDLPAMLDHVRGADALSLPWRFFGNGGIAGYQDEPITAQFIQTGPYPIQFPRQAMMFKTLFRPGALWSKPGIHAPRPKGIPDWRQGDGRPVSDQFNPTRPLLHGADMGNSIGQINHYALRSRESFLVKAARGLPNRQTVPIDLSYWVMRNFCDQGDDRLLGHQDALAEEVARLRGLPDVAALHQAAVDWHRKEIDRLMSTETGIALYAALSVTGPTIVPNDADTTRIYRGMADVYGKVA